MKRTQFRYIVPTLIIFILSLLCTSVSAYQVNKTSGGADIKWNTNNVTYYVNTSGGPSGSLAAIQAAMQTWTDVSTSSFNFIYGGTTSSTAFGINDSINIVYFGPSDSYLWEYRYWYYTDSGLLIDCDLKFNNNYSWGTDGSANKFDVQNVGTALFGNALSLDLLYNSGDSEKTMYGYVSYGETKKRTLHQDDVDGITYLYPSDITTQKFQWPVDSPNITQYYSAYNDGSAGKYHTGLDIISSTGSTKVYAADSGIVKRIDNNTYSNQNHGMGNVVIIAHNTGQGTIYTLYAHLASILVDNEQYVTKGTQIGVMGKTGNVTGVKSTRSIGEFRRRSWPLLGIHS